MSIAIENLSKRFGDFVALDGIGLDVGEGELLALLGPSGSGKTTLLRIVAGLEHADAGRVLFDGQDATGLSVQARRAGFVFQHYALFRHMSVRENIAFGLRVRCGRERWPDARIRERVRELLALVRLQGLEDRYPAQLSGGQQQRVALARALAIEPRVLLLDEPFGALDARVRRELRRWLRELHERTGLTTVFVTHDQEEALELADRVAILERGRIEQVGSPADIYDAPRTPFVYRFVGEANRLPGRAAQGRVRVAGLDLAADVADGAVDLYVRPEDLRVAAGGAGWPATVLSCLRNGPRLRVRAKLHDAARTEVDIDLPPTGAEEVGIPQPGTAVVLSPRRFGVFPATAAG